MGFKKFFSESFGGFVLKNLLIAVIIVFILSWLTLFLIEKGTQHGQTVIVPDLKGLYVEEAQSLLSKQELYVQVIDSMYLKGKPLGSILEQTPTAGSVVKKDRPVYLVINSRQIKKVPVPDVLENSYRQADATIKALGLQVQNVEYVPSEYKNLVLSIKYQGVELQPGTRIPDGSAVVLVVGRGIGTEQNIVPIMREMRLEQAREVLLQAGFVAGAIEYDTTPNGNENLYFIYRQQPAAGKTATAGTRIDLWLTKDRDKLNQSFDNEDEEFF